VIQNPVAPPLRGLGARRPGPRRLARGPARPCPAGAALVPCAPPAPRPRAGAPPAARAPVRRVRRARAARPRAAGARRAAGGAVHVIVPFMFRIHGHPDDYFRATPSWWRETFDRTGFARLDLMPLVWGRGATRAVVPGLHGAFPRARMHLAMLFDVLFAALMLKGDRISGRRGASICGTAPGWFMTGWKGKA